MLGAGWPRIGPAGTDARAVRGSRRKPALVERALACLGFAAKHGWPVKRKSLSIAEGERRLLPHQNNREADVTRIMM